MSTFCKLCLSLIFLVLASIHFYWVAGGKWGLAAALPSSSSEEFLFEPGRVGTFLVGLILFLLSLFYLLQLESISQIRLPKNLQLWAGLLIGILFLLRAIGDFQYLGFFKKVEHSSFAQMDNLLYSPLCLCISAMAFFLCYQHWRGE